MVRPALVTPKNATASPSSAPTGNASNGLRPVSTRWPGSRVPSVDVAAADDGVGRGEVQADPQHHAGGQGAADHHRGQRGDLGMVEREAATSSPRASPATIATTT